MKKALLIITAPLWLPVLFVIFAIAALIKLPAGTRSYGEPLPHH